MCRLNSNVDDFVMVESFFWSLTSRFRKQTGQGQTDRGKKMEKPQSDHLSYFEFPAVALQRSIPLHVGANTFA